MMTILRFLNISYLLLIIIFVPVQSHAGPKGALGESVDLTTLSWKAGTGLIPPDKLPLALPDFKDAPVFPIFPNKIFPHKRGTTLQTFTLSTFFSLNDALLEKGRLAIKLSGIGENWRIYLNGHLVEDAMHITENGELSVYRHVRKLILPIPDRVLKKDNHLVIHLAGYPSRFFGLNNIFLGLNYSKGYSIAPEESFRNPLAGSIELILFSIYIFFGLYHLFIYVRNKAHLYNFFFSIFFISLTVYFFALSDLAFQLIYNTRYLIFVNNAIQPIAIAVFLLFIRDFLFPGKPWRTTKALVLSNIPFVIGFILSPVYLYHQILLLWYIVLVPQLIHVIYLIIKAVLQKKEDALIVCLATFQGILFIIWDILDTMFFHTSMWLLMFSFIFVTLSFVLILANRFLRWYDTSIELTRLREEQLFKDILTGLPNRTKLIHDAVASPCYSIIVFQIQGLVRLNNIYGPSKVDEIFREYVTSVIDVHKSVLYDIYRLNWGEFAFVFTRKIRYEKVRTLVNEVIQSAENWKSDIDGLEEVVIEIIAGVSHGSEKPVESGLKEADMAINYAKDRRLPFARYRGIMDQEQTHRENLMWIKKVRLALVESRVVVQYQPILNNKTGVIEKYESLVRLEDQDGSHIMPGLFLPAISESKLVNKLTESVISNVCRSIGSTETDYSVNIFAEQLVDSNISELIVRYVKEYGIENRIVVEILESEKITDYELISKELEKLRKSGIKVAIDDFGTGYSNFGHIINLPLDYIKIDGSLIKHIHEDETSQVLVKNIVNICTSLKIKTIAEFVHCREVQDVLISLGVDYSQGFFIGKPVPINT